MSKPKPRRPKSEVEDEIDLSYYANSPTLQGMLSHLKPELIVTSPEVSSPVESRLEATTREPEDDRASESKLAAGEGFTPEVSLPDDNASAVSATETESAAVAASTPTVASPVVTSYEASVAVDVSKLVFVPLARNVPSLGRRRVLHVGNSAQSAHSALENQFYTWAWRHAAPSDADRRCLRGSPAKISVIAREMNITERSTIELLKRMVEKLAMDVCDGWVHGSQEGKSYWVYSLRKILDRRRQCGLEYAIKGKGVILITEEQAKAIEAMNQKTVVLETYGDDQPSAGSTQD